MLFGFTGIQEALLLIGLGMGYIVLYFAKREEKGLQLLGYAIGTVIIILTLIYLFDNILTKFNTVYPKMGYNKGMMQQHMMRPQMMPNAPSQRR
jgi:hypothetical protein